MVRSFTPGEAVARRHTVTVETPVKYQSRVAADRPHISPSDLGPSL